MTKLKYRTEIEQYVEAHREDLIQDVIRLCRVDSQKREYKEGYPFGEGVGIALNLALDMAASYGFQTSNYDNYAGAVDLNDKPKQLDILAHLDVVPEGEGWEITEPFSPLLKEGRIYARGASDNKGPAAASLLALRCVKDLGIPLKKNVRLVLGTDEECGGECIAHYYAKEQEAPMTFSPDGEYPVVNIEKGRLPGEFEGKFEREHGEKRLVLFEAGTKINVVPPKARVVLEGFDFEEVTKTAKEVTEETGIRFSFDLEPVFEITALGTNAHASTPEHGNNAITGMLTLLSRLSLGKGKKAEAIRTLARLMPHGETDGKSLGIAQKDEESGALTLAFTMLEIRENVFHGFFDCRIPVRGQGEKILQCCREKFQEGDMVFLNTSVIPPHAVDGDSHFVKTLLKVYEAYTGLPGGCIAMGGGTYVHDLKNGVAFGAVFPGTDTRMHGPDEFVVVDQLMASAKIFAQVIVELCS